MTVARKWRRRCQNGVTRSTGRRSRASPKRFLRCFRDRRSSMLWAAVSLRQRRGSRSIPTGGPIHYGQTGLPARLRGAAAPRPDGCGGSPMKSRPARDGAKRTMASPLPTLPLPPPFPPPLAGEGGGGARGRVGREQQVSGFRQHLIASNATRAGRAFAAFAASRSTGSDGTLTCGIAARTGMPSGTPPAWLRGIFGRRRATIGVSSGDCRIGDALRPADAYGRRRRLITACRCSACGASIVRRHGRRCLTSGACQICKSSIRMLTWENAPRRRSFGACSRTACNRIDPRVKLAGDARGVDRPI